MEVDKLWDRRVVVVFSTVGKFDRLRNENSTMRVKRTVHSDLSSATAEHAQKPGDARHLLIRVSMVTKTLV